MAGAEACVIQSVQTINKEHPASWGSCPKSKVTAVWN